MASYIIKTIEGRKFLTCNIAGTFLKLGWPKDILTYLKFDRIMVNMLCEIYLSFEYYVHKTRNGKKLMPSDTIGVIFGGMMLN